MEIVPNFIKEQFWLPIPATIMLFLWSWLYAYPLYLEKWIRDKRSPKLWLYIPNWWRGAIKGFAAPVSILLVLVAAYLWMGALANVSENPTILGVLFVMILVALLFLRHFAMSRNYILQRECYFHDYKRIAYEAHTRGKSPSEVELKNLCMYEHQQSMRKADQSGRFTKYLRIKAKSQKEVVVLDDNLGIHD